MTALLQSAIAAHQANNLGEAEKLYRDFLVAAPDHADALALLALVRGALGDHEEAIALAEKAVRIDPNAALLRFHQATVLMNAKKLPEAIAAFRHAVTLQPGFASAWYNLGNALRASNDWIGAIDAYRNAIQFKPDYVEAYNNLALTLSHEQKLDEALEEAKKSVAVAPNYGEGWRTICNIAEGVKNYPLALQAGEQCIRLMPNSHFAWFGYGVALNRLDRHEEAIEAYKRALTLKPDRADIWDNLGQTYQSLNRLDEAEVTFRKTLDVAGQVITDEDNRDVNEDEYGNRHWHLALMELLRGKYPQGFARYRARFKDVGGLKRPNYPVPLWKGENLSGRTILICDEQGFGDTIMLARYLLILKAQGTYIIFSVHPVLEKLFMDSGLADQIITHGTKIPPCDYHASVFDLPHRLKTTLETIPSHTPYIQVPAMNAAHKLETNGRKKIGVVWGGSGLHGNDVRRSIPLKIFEHIFAVPNVQFYSFNRDLKAGDTERLRHLPIINLVPRINDFADAAQFIAQMDAVITCDTATAHLAGALGKTLWVLLPFAPDWRWLTGRSDSPWYPTARLFRQPCVGDWDGVMEEVKNNLQRMAD
jgi:tetratricopeptide (TPR) repeat protein